MATETLSIKEDYLDEFIAILEMGILTTENKYGEISPKLKHSLTEWIIQEQDYLRRLSDED